MELFIPTRINKDNIFGNGFGKKEVKTIVIAIILSLIVGFVIGICFLHDIKAILILTVCVGLVTAVVSHYLLVKDSLNLSVYIYIQLIVAFLKNQKFYQYKRLKEWV